MNLTLKLILKLILSLVLLAALAATTTMSLNLAVSYETEFHGLHPALAVTLVTAETLCVSLVLILIWVTKVTHPHDDDIVGVVVED